MRRSESSSAVADARIVLIALLGQNIGHFIRIFFFQSVGVFEASISESHETERESDARIWGESFIALPKSAATELLVW